MLLKKKKIPEYITNNIEMSSDSDREDSDKILLEKIKYRMCLIFVFQVFRVILGY